ncbi:monocarboxylate transporter 14-like isoform X2 [Onthophagus taurus]|uniref:monocarboxylate transporter 14-like isoform X2 n=1 Tax=Onthophagus taurus TaxID=166361 RepID=UPI0039BE586B
MTPRHHRHRSSDMSPPNGVPPGSENGYIPVTTNEDEEDDELEAADAATPLEHVTRNGVGAAAAGDISSKATTTSLLLKKKAENGSSSQKENGGGGDEDGSETGEDDPEIVVPPDGGWGWVVVAASFFCNMVVDGTVFCFGILAQDLENEFGASKAHVALVGSLMSGFYLMVGPFVSALANRYGFRIVAIVGSLLAAAAFSVSYFATSVTFLCVTYGLIGGIGFGFIYVPAVITVGFYFEKWRALATGIGVCGSGIGNFILPPIFSYITKNYSWRIAILVQAAMAFGCLFAGLCFKPLKPTKVKDIKQEQPELIMDKTRLPSKTRRQMELALKNFKGNSVHLSHSTITRILGANNNCDYPTVADVYHTINVPRHDRVRFREKRFSDPFAEDEKKDGEPLLEDKTFQVIVQKQIRKRTNSESSNPRSRKNTLSEVNRPFYRDDICFSGSLTRLPQFMSKTSLEYNLAVTRVPTKHDIEEEYLPGCKICPEAMRRTLATMLDFSLLKSPSFILMALSGFFTMMGFYTPYMYIKTRAENEFHLDVSLTTWLISTIGIANTIGRILCGALSFFPKISTLWVNNIALSISGIVTIMSGLSMTAEYQFFYSVMFGLTISSFASLRSILVVELLGLSKLTNAFGLLLLFQGIAAAVGSPIAGAFMEMTQSYDASFYLSGSLLLMSGLVCYPLSCVNKWEENKKEKDEKESSNNVPV